MKNVVCPISNEKIAGYVPRIIAIINITLIVLYIYLRSPIILAFLIFDFGARGFGYGQFSIIQKLALAIGKGLKFKSKKIDKAPKVFAAKLGTIMFVLAFSFALFGSPIAALSVLGIVITLSALEGVFSVCVGCYLYTYIVLPYFQHNTTNTI